MEFDNKSPYVAEIFRTELERDVLYNAVVIRCRYTLREGRILEPTPGAGGLTDLRRSRLEDEFGVLEPDGIVGRTGTDVVVRGHARAPSGSVRKMLVRVLAGPYDFPLAVYGLRIWERPFGIGTLRLSAPLPFEQLPVSYKLAYGGKIPTPDGELVDGRNPIGTGFYLQESDAIGQPAPHLEDPVQPLTRWDERPEPLAFGPYCRSWALRMLQAMDPPIEGKTPQIHLDRGLFDQAHPRLSGKEVREGDWVQVQGMSVAGSLRFAVPACPVKVDVQLGLKHHPALPRLEEVFLDTDLGFVDFTYRRMFHYRFQLHQKRKTVVRELRGAKD